MSTTTIHQTILNGPNRFARILGHATLNGLPVRLRVRVGGWGLGQAIIECTDATRENDGWHQLGGNYSLAMPFDRMLQAIPCVAQLQLTPALLVARAEVL